MKLKEIFKSDKYYSVCICDKVKGLVLDVVCGGVGMYSRIIELTQDEINEFKEKGNLDDLAYRIAKGDEDILKRELMPETNQESIEYVKKL